MGAELEDKAKELANVLVGSLKGRVRELYHNRIQVRDLVLRTSQNAAKLALELVAEKNKDRQESIKESLRTAEDTVANEVAALCQDSATEARNWLTDALQMLISFAREAAPLMAEYAIKKGAK